MPYPLLLHAKHAEFPVTYEAMGEWLLPWRFGQTETETHAVHRSAGLADCSFYAIIEVGGADAADFLQRLLTNDIKALRPGKAVRAALLTGNGKLLAELVVLARERTFWLLCDAVRAPRVAETLERYHFAEEVTITDRGRSHAALGVFGPKAQEALSRLAGDAAVSLLPLEYREAHLESIPAMLLTYSPVGDTGVLCLVAADRALAAWELLNAALPADGCTVGWEALNTFRIENGVPWNGVDTDEENLLPETGLDDLLISETKGCYVGQEIVARMRTYGSANKQLMGLAIEGAVLPKAKDKLATGQEETGWITSACRSPSFGVIALGYVKRGWYEPGMKLEVVSADAHQAATVVKLPFVQSSAQ